MRIQDYLNVVVKRWWLILLVAFSAAVAAYGFSKLRTPMYRSQTIYSVLFNRLDTGGNMFADQLLNGYVNYVYQPDRMQEISNRLGLDQPGQALMEYVRLQAQPDQMLIVIEADYFDPASAQAIATAVGDQLNSYVVEANRNLEGEDRVSLTRAQSAPPGYLAKPITRVNVLAGALLGAVIGLLLCFILDYMDDTLKNAADVERFAELTTVGAIPAPGSLDNRRRAALRPSAASGLIAASLGGPGEGLRKRSTAKTRDQ